ncbi:uncharacterized protein LOC116190193 isoform X1 [Punica granatum]|uniref:Uncharacterized protein LOC116190193 isoform X1 n=1 Tax=Punica granatum TaxID=22663 RepID=A0A6P8BZE8_PUNGR|nr:uncharacterized protein LOC116190193 isoform X1 [Punica granatum]
MGQTGQQQSSDLLTREARRRQQRLDLLGLTQLTNRTMAQAVPAQSRSTAQMQILQFGREKAKFGNLSLDIYQTSNQSYRPKKAHLDRNNFSKEQLCLLDHFWVGLHANPINVKKLSHVVNCLAEYFATTPQGGYPFFVVLNGQMPGVFNSWTDVLDQIQDFSEAQWEGYHTLHEAFAVARSRIGINYYVCPALRHYQDSSQEASTSQGPSREQTMAGLFCSSCQGNEQTIKRLTYTLDKHTSEEMKMIEENDRLQRELSAAKREIERLRAIERACISTTPIPPQIQPSQTQTQTQSQTQMAQPSQVSAETQLNAAMPHLLPCKRPRAGISRPLMAESLPESTLSVEQTTAQTTQPGIVICESSTAQAIQTPQRTKQVLPEDIMATINAMRTEDQARKEAKRAKKKQEMAEMIAMMLRKSGLQPPPMQTDSPRSNSSTKDVDLDQDTDNYLAALTQMSNEAREEAASSPQGHLDTNPGSPMS